MKVILHICCAVCAGPCLERLRQEGHEVSGYFYNPNIHPEEEYLRRLEDTKRLATELGLPLTIGDYDKDEWFSKIKGLEQEPEGGKRCAECFRLRLKQTKRLTEEKGFDSFTTTLTISPHKDAQLINEMGRNIGNGLFLARDFKKQDGFKKAQQLSQKYNLYHQNYCGCTYSLKEKEKQCPDTVKNTPSQA